MCTPIILFSEKVLISAVAIRLPLLLTVRGKYAGRISTVAVERLVKTHAANTEAKAKTPHAFRRTYGSNLLNDEKYGDLGLTAELLGHKQSVDNAGLIQQSQAGTAERCF